MCRGVLDNLRRKEILLTLQGPENRWSMNPCIAIIDNNALGRSALQNIILEVFGSIEVYPYGTMEDFIRDSNRHFIHFFVSADILFRHIDEFETLQSRTTVMCEGQSRRFEAAGYNVLDISLPVREITGRLTVMNLVSRYEERGTKTYNIKEMLSAREKEVLRLMVKGLINKEIAEELGVSLPTAIFHRNNVCEKLKTRSLGRLTIYAVMTGIVDINEI